MFIDTTSIWFIIAVVLIINFIDEILGDKE